MKKFIIFCCLIAGAVAFPTNQELPRPAVQTDIRNVIDVPIICPPNQKPDQNGRCREVWRIAQFNENTLACLIGKRLGLTEICVDSKIAIDKNVIDAPIICPEGQKPDQNGKCREIWVALSDVDTDVEDRNVIDVPVVCPVGQKPDQNGKCREQWTARSDVEPQNVIDVPIVCPVGQKPDQNGKCREVWTFGGLPITFT